MKAIVITGSMGSGKTTALGEASDLLAIRGIVHATIDVDALANGHLPCTALDDTLAYTNLRSIYENYVAAGVKMFLVAEALESREDLERLREALGQPELVVCRLRAPLVTMQQRVRLREPGVSQQKFVDRAAELERIIDEAAVEDFSIVNDGRSVTDVATDMLVRAGWV